MARRGSSRFVRLVDRLCVGSRAEAIQLIEGGRVTVDGVIVSNPRALVARDAAVTVVEPRTLRGTIKLRAALSHFAADVAGQVCLDLGASAGGFTTALLEAEAATVYAVDTGYGQLLGRLRQEPRVVNLERTNLRDLSTDLVPEPVGVLCLDLSYVSLADALPQLGGIRWARAAQLLALVKPTFELHSARLVDDDESVAKAVAVARAAAEGSGWLDLSTTPAPTTGDAGAPEVFLYGRRATP